MAFSLRNLDWNNAGAFPTSVKAFFAGLIFLFIAFFAWYLWIGDQRDELQTLAQREAELKADFELKAAKAANLEPLKAQLVSMRALLDQMLRQLPSRTEMPDLIVDISQTALKSGITNELFQPGPEIKRDFYAEKPITLRLVGGYHEFGNFVSGVASLPRVVIMTMHDIALKPSTREDAARDDLVLEGTVKTYRYLDDSEIAEQAAAPEEVTP